MRGKRSKQYRKLMQQYGMTFSFREPYQVLLDADIILDAARYKMDLIGGLQRTLHGKIKPMITQCSMRHLYGADPRAPNQIEEAKQYERRRCNHHTLEEPLTALECLSSVVDPKESKTNKHRYVVASQDQTVRSAMRQIPGVPLVYINRSVMIMEPMADATEDAREKEERGKFRLGLKSRGRPGSTLKRKREDWGVDESRGETQQHQPGLGEDRIPNNAGDEGLSRKKGKKTRGPKEPNPLSVRKSKKAPIGEEGSEPINEPVISSKLSDTGLNSEENPSSIGPTNAPIKPKRKRKHKSGAASLESGGVMVAV
ncbi:MAG: hypothetical protein M1812_003162 [Candelaria pacifica]|nr:MAG: hypothetical protein M1812_003162 [Candelaria pacifica]